MPVGTTSRDVVVKVGLPVPVDDDEVWVSSTVASGAVPVGVDVTVTVLLLEAHSLPKIT